MPLKFFNEYDEANKFWKEQKDLNKCGDDKEEVFLCSRADDDHYLLIDRLINEYLNSGCVIDQPVIVFYKQSKQYEIVPREILSNEHWVERPYTLFGSIFDNNVLIRDPSKILKRTDS